MMIDMNYGSQIRIMSNYINNKNLAKQNGYNLDNLEVKFIDDTNTLGANNQKFKGNYNQQNNTITLNLANIKNLNEFTNTLGHELTHAIKSHQNSFIPQDNLQNNYANIKGEILSNYLNKALNLKDENVNLNNTNLNCTNNTNTKDTLLSNLDKFNYQDMSKSDNKINLFDPNEPSSEKQSPNQKLDTSANYNFYSNANASGVIREFISGYRELYIGAHGGGDKIGTQRGKACNAEEVYDNFIINDKTWKKGKVESIYLGVCNSTNFAQELSNVIYKKTGKSITVYGSDGYYYYNQVYHLPFFNKSEKGMIAFKPNIKKEKKLKQNLESLCFW